MVNIEMSSDLWVHCFAIGCRDSVASGLLLYRGSRDLFEV